MSCCRYAMTLTTLTLITCEWLLVSGRIYLCPAGRIFSGTELTSVRGRSLIHCGVLCSQSEACQAVNVCPDDLSNAVTCSLLGDSSPTGCDGLSAAPFPGCRYGKHRQDKLSCANGGTWDGMRCRCSIEFSGSTCQRRIRDCQEAIDNGYQGDQYSGVYLIHPMTAPQPFPVYCSILWGVNLVYAHYHPAMPLNWTTAKRGVGYTSTTIPDKLSFFIGLESIYHLLQQSVYESQIYIQYNDWSTDGSAYYKNFTVGNESSSFALAYDSYASGVNQADEGFSSMSPLIFSTSDNDPKGCVSSRGAPGWYGPDCAVNDMFRETGMGWPVSGVQKSLDSIQLNIIRQGQLPPL